MSLSIIRVIINPVTCVMFDHQALGSFCVEFHLVCISWAPFHRPKMYENFTSNGPLWSKRTVIQHVVGFIKCDS